MSQTEVMLTQPTIEKLMSMRLRGMAESRSGNSRARKLATAELRRTARAADRPTVELAREPRAGTGAAQRRLQGPACVEDIDYGAGLGRGGNSTTGSQPGFANTRTCF